MKNNKQIIINKILIINQKNKIIFIFVMLIMIIFYLNKLYFINNRENFKLLEKNYWNVLKYVTKYMDHNMNKLCKYSIN